MRKILLLCYLFIGIALYSPIRAQVVKVQTISIEDADKHIGVVVKLNCDGYKTVDDGKTLTISMKIKSPKKTLTLMLTGESRKVTLTEMRIRRELNRQIKQPLDTSITATGKIILYNRDLRMVVGNSADVYLGADLEVERR